MRKVKYKIWEKDSNGKFILSEEKCGFFHQWGTRIEESRDSMCQETVAIVEDEKSNRIVFAIPELIQFI